MESLTKCHRTIFLPDRLLLRSSLLPARVKIQGWYSDLYKMSLFPAKYPFPRQFLSATCIFSPKHCLMWLHHFSFWQHLWKETISETLRSCESFPLCCRILDLKPFSMQRESLVLCWCYYCRQNMHFLSTKENLVFCARSWFRSLGSRAFRDGFCLFLLMLCVGEQIYLSSST